MPDFKKFNDPRILANKKDANKKTPEVFVSCGNRGAGKTYGWAWAILEGALGRPFLPTDVFKPGRFTLVGRWEREIGGLAQGIFQDIMQMEYENATITSRMSPDKLFAEIFYNEKDQKPVLVGRALPINKADDIKKISHIVCDTEVMLVDEFQCGSDSSYVPDEVEKFIRLHISCARGQGHASRRLPVVMLSNSVSVTNPYFIYMKVHNKIQSNTKLLKGDSFVLERFVNPNSANELMESGFNRVFSGSKELECSIDNSWLNDDSSCLEKPDITWGRSIYYWTLVSDNRKYGVRYFPGMDLWTLNESVDGSCGYVFNISVNGNLNVPMLRHNPQMKMLREAFTQGRMRFPNQACKAIALELFV